MRYDRKERIKKNEIREAKKIARQHRKSSKQTGGRAREKFARGPQLTRETADKDAEEDRKEDGKNNGASKRVSPTEIPVGASLAE